MKMKALLLVVLVGGVVALVAVLGFKSGEAPFVQPVMATSTAPAEKAALPLMEDLAQPVAMDVPKLIRDWETSHTFEEWDASAAGLAEADTVESVGALMRGVFETADWEARVKLARNLRAVSNPEVLQVMLTSLTVDFGRGSPVVGEICDVISRLAQSDTVEALAAMHWQAGGQGVDSHKVIRAVAGIRNPAARKALEKLSANPQAAESLRLAAQEALLAMAATTGVNP